MSKRRREATSSSGGESDNADGYGGAKVSGQLQLANGNGSCSAVSEQKETGPVASTLTQRRGVIVKEEPEEDEVHEIIVKEELDLVESEVEDSDLTTSPQLRIDRSYSCSGSSTGQQSKPKERRKRVLSNLQMMPDVRGSKEQTIPENPQRPPPSKMVHDVNPHEKYTEGSLVMGWGDMGSPYWPGMIRKASAEEHPRFPVYTRNYRRKVEFFVQFFSDPTTLHWRRAGELGVFEVASPNQCLSWDSNVIAKFEKGIRIAKAALNLSVELRLSTCTLPRGARIDDLLGGIESNQDVPEVQRDDSVDSPFGLGTGGLLRQKDLLVAEEENGPAQGNRRSIQDVIAGLKNQAKLLVQKDLEKEAVIKALTKDNSKLKTANKDLKLQLQSKNELIAELRINLAKSNKDKQECRQELEKMRSELEGLEGIFKGELGHK